MLLLLLLICCTPNQSCSRILRELWVQEAAVGVLQADDWPHSSINVMFEYHVQHDNGLLTGSDLSGQPAVDSTRSDTSEAHTHARSDTHHAALTTACDPCWQLLSHPTHALYCSLYEMSLASLSPAAPAAGPYGTASPQE